MSRYEALPENIRFTKVFYKEVRDYLTKDDKLYMVRIDSDNMYHQSYIQQLHDVKINPDILVIMSQHGYTYHVGTKGLCHFYHESPSFYAIVYTYEEYINGKKINAKRGHLDMIKFNHVILSPKNFMIVVHEQNILNRFNDQLCHGRIEGEERLAVLREFEIE
ncbi:MAG: hypothetical protein ACRDDX_12360 [Cellulosilyticaceae bacterium]